MADATKILRDLDRQIAAATAAGEDGERNALSAEWNASLDLLTDEHSEGEHADGIYVDCPRCRDEARELGIALPRAGRGPTSVPAVSPRQDS